jgi:hypothetical protein
MLKDGLHALLLRLMQPRLMRWRQALAIIVVVQADRRGAGAAAARPQQRARALLPHDAPATVLERELRTEFPNDEILIGLFAGEGCTARRRWRRARSRERAHGASP